MIWVSIAAHGELTNGMWEGLRRIERGYEKSYGVAVYLFHKRDGIHSAGTLHYSGNGIDIGYPDKVKGERAKRQVCDNIATWLNYDYDVVYHSSHCHIEFDPK